MPRLIVVADDFGVNPCRDAGIATAFHRGAVNRVSMLVNGEDPEATARLAADQGLSDVLGLHVNLTEGVPISAPESVPSLTGPDGRLLGKEAFFQALDRQAIDQQDVARELEAQFVRFNQLIGRNSTYADGHHHVHVFGPLVPTMAAVFRHNGVTTTRIPDDVAFCVDLDAAAHTAALAMRGRAALNGAPFYLRVCQEASKARPVYAASGVAGSAVFLGLGLMGQAMAVDKLLGLLRSATDSLAVGDGKEEVHVMCHPGVRWSPGPALFGPQDAFWHCPFSCSADREHEAAVLCDPRLLYGLRTSVDLECPLLPATTE